MSIVGFVNFLKSRFDGESGALKLLQSVSTGKKPNWVEFVSFP